MASADHERWGNIWGKDPTGTDAEEKVSTERVPQKIFKWGFYNLFFIIYFLEGDNFGRGMSLGCGVLPTHAGERAESEAARCCRRRWGGDQKHAPVSVGDFGRLSSRNGPALLPALPYPGASHPPPGLVGVPCVLGAGGSDAATVRIGWGERRDTSPPTYVFFPAWAGGRAPRQRHRADQASGLCGKDLEKQLLCHLGLVLLFGWLVVGFWFFVVVVLPPPLSLYFSSCHPKSFFFLLSCWPPCLPYGWGYLRRISQRIAP